MESQSLQDRQAFEKKIQEKLESILGFLNYYLPLAGQNTIDFFIKNLWETCFPKTIREDISALKDVEKRTFGSYAVLENPNFLFKSSELTEEEIAEFESEAVLMNWNLKHSRLKPFLEDARSILSDVLGPEVVTPLALINADGGFREQTTVSIPHLISPKKCHEVDIMADLCAKMARKMEAPAIVDLGSGKGYLGTKLAFAYKLNVLGVDCSETNTDGAMKRNEKLNKKWDTLVKTYQGSESDLKDANRQYQALTDFVTPETDFHSLIGQNFATDSRNRKRCLMIGLHTCGDLAVNSLRIFCTNTTVQAVCNVGCCYEHVSELLPESDAGADEGKCGECSKASSVPGFPMSKFLQRKNVKLGKQVRSLASQPLSRIAEGNRLPAKSLFWRAVLQRILTDQHGGQSRDVWMVGKAGNKCHNFLDYCRKSLIKLKMGDLSEALTDETLAAYEKQYLDREEDIYAFFQLRIVLSPLIEALIILDRLLYLLEQEVVAGVHLIRIFDPVLSPRCHALLAWKNPPKQESHS